MSDHATLITAIRSWLSTHDPVQVEIHRHEMSATVHRYNTTKVDLGLGSMNTVQLAWCVLGSELNPEDLVQCGLYGAFLTSLLLDGEWELFSVAKATQCIPQHLDWIAWAEDFQGSEADLLRRLSALRVIRDFAGASVLAARSCPQAVGANLLRRLAHPGLALVFHRVLALGLGGSHAPLLAHQALQLWAEHSDVLFAVPVDEAIARVVAKVDNGQAERLLEPLRVACGEQTQVTLAENHLRAGRYQEAFDLIKDMRFLSPYLGRAATVATLACLELSRLSDAEAYARLVEDPLTRARIGVRLAQLRGDEVAEEAAIRALYALQVDDTETLAVLLRCLVRSGKREELAHICTQQHGRHNHHKELAAFLERYAVSDVKR